MSFSCHSHGVQIIENVYGWNFFSSVEADVLDGNVFKCLDMALCSKLVLVNLIEERKVKVLQKGNITCLLHR